MNHNFPKVSVIIPVYNHERYVEDAILSVLEQDYQNIELIVINDGSTDNSNEKIIELSERCTFKYINQKNQGLSQTLLNGLALSTGEYFAIVASDDQWLKHKLTVQIEHMLAHSDTVACCALVNIIDEHNNVTLRKPGEKVERYDFCKIMMKGFNIPPATILINKKVLSNDCFDPTLKVEDLYLWLKITESGGYVDVLPDVLANYRIHSTNTTGNLSLIAKYHHIIIDRFRNYAMYRNAKSRWCRFSFRQLTRNYKKESLKYLYPDISFYGSIDFAIGIIKLIFVWPSKNG